MSTYYTEGFIKEIRVCEVGRRCKVSFKMEPAAPYLFEHKKVDGTTERCILFVECNNIDAKILNSSQEIKAPSKCDLNTLLIAKANRMKVSVAATVVVEGDEPMPIKGITVL